MTIQEAIAAALRGEALSRADVAAVFGAIMDGAATPAQIGGLLVALRAKGETVDELIGAASAMRARALALPCAAAVTIDTCGTGGDGAGTINVSTLAALILAGCGQTVAKHGNRAQSSKCGSADVLEALGVKVDAGQDVVARCLAEASLGFAFAPTFHAATRHAAGPRRELGTRTIFNLLGPLTNPARVTHQVVGVFDAVWCEPLARALGGLGVRRAAVVHGAGGPGAAGGVDEIAVRGDTRVAIWDGEASVHVLSPRAFGLEEVDPAGLDGGDPSFNAAVLRRALAGFDIAPDAPLRAVHNAAVMTAALALELVEDRALDLTALPAQCARASRALHDGSAALALDALVRISGAA
jgi:anthranilate phosphoribosyltransferase